MCVCVCTTMCVTEKNKKKCRKKMTRNKRKKEIKSVYSSKVKRDFDENDDKCNAQSSKK